MYFIMQNTRCLKEAFDFRLISHAINRNFSISVFVNALADNLVGQGFSPWERGCLAEWFKKNVFFFLPVG